MIVVKLIGGLGNQLFQYSLAKHLAIINQTKVLLDIIAFEDFYKLHKYSLQHFNIDAKIGSRQELENIYNFPHSLNRLERVWKYRILGQQFYHITEKQFNFDDIVLQKYHGNVLLDGYWQTEKYFAVIESQLRKDLIINTLQDEIDTKIFQQICNSNAVSLHIRRADYTNIETAKIHGFCSLDYYKKAIEIIASKVTSPTFFVFSDDIAWAKDNLKADFPLVFVGHNDANKNYEDLRLMSSCQHHIIANSSFSWWGAWLNPNPNKIVIAPEKWFATNQMNYEDVIPKKWIKI